jgi:hypothetical protein
MCIRLARTLALALTASNLAFGSANAQGYPQKFEFGQPAAESDIAAVDIAIPADGRGLPAGKGDYATGNRSTNGHAQPAMAPTWRASPTFPTCPRAGRCASSADAGR